MEIITANIEKIITFAAGGGLGFLFFFLGLILNSVINIIKAKKNPQKYLNDFVYKQSSRVNKHFLSKIKDADLRDNSIILLDSFGDIIDNAWDAGLRGLEKPEI